MDGECVSPHRGAAGIPDAAAALGRLFVDKAFGHLRVGAGGYQPNQFSVVSEHRTAAVTVVGGQLYRQEVAARGVGTGDSARE